MAPGTISFEIGAGQTPGIIGQYDVAEEIFGPCAGAALYHRPMLDEIGPFDEDFSFFFLKMLISRSVHGLPVGNVCMCQQPG